MDYRTNNTHNKAMAMVKTKGPVIQSQGKQGGNVDRFDQCGQHKQTTPRIINKEPSPRQRIVRNCFRKVARFFYSQLTGDQYKQWYIWARNHPQKNHKGETYWYTPYGAFTHFNFVRCREGLDCLLTPPE